MTDSPTPPPNGFPPKASAEGPGAEPAPELMRRLDSPGAAALADLSATFEDMQTVLRCCERLVAELAGGASDDVVVEAVWTTALLSYARCFAAGAGPDGPGPDGPGSRLTEDDLTAAQPEGDVLGWHRLLLQLRDHYCDGVANPRERFSVAVAQTSDGTAGGVGITSARQPLVDDVTVRQTGAIAFALSRTLDQRIAVRQDEVFTELRDLPVAAIEKLPQLEVVRPE